MQTCCLTIAEAMGIPMISTKPFICRNKIFMPCYTDQKYFFMSLHFHLLWSCCFVLRAPPETEEVTAVSQTGQAEICWGN